MACFVKKLNFFGNGLISQCQFLLNHPSSFFGIDISFCLPIIKLSVLIKEYLKKFKGMAVSSIITVVFHDRQGLITAFGIRSSRQMHNVFDVFNNIDLHLIGGL